MSDAKKCQTCGSDRRDNAACIADHDETDACYECRDPWHTQGQTPDPPHERLNCLGYKIGLTGGGAKAATKQKLLDKLPEEIRGILAKLRIQELEIFLKWAGERPTGREDSDTLPRKEKA